MKKLSLLSTLMLFVIAAMQPHHLNAQVSVWDGTYTPWTNGTGTEADPFLIENAQQLAYLTYRVNNGLDAAGGHVSNHDLHYKLMIDVNLNGSESFQWTPIGYWTSETNYYCFGGHFDGNNHTVSGLYINSSANRVGFFGYTNGAEIKNLNMNDGVVSTTGSYAGNLIGYTAGVTVTNCNNTNNIVSSSPTNSWLGGLVGCASSVESVVITNCHNSGNISSSYSSCSGGIVGYIYSSSTFTITNCYNTGDILSTNSNLGGIIGYVYSGTITIKDCYNTGNVSSSSSGPNSSVGGIVGRPYGTTITNSYNIGSIIGYTPYSGGIVGRTASVINCYYLDICGGNNTYGGSPMSSAAMQTAEFVDIINNGSCAYEQDVVPYTNSGYPILTMVIRNAQTLNATNVTQSHCTLKGTISLENDILLSTGFMYKETNSPNYMHVSCSSATDTITHTLSGLKPSTNYTYKTFMLTAGCDTTFGTSKAFTTSSISTSSDYATNVTQTHATLNGSFTIGDANMSSYGFEYRKYTDTVFQTVTVSGEGSVSETVTGLTPSTQYTYRTYCAAVGCEPIYGNCRNFTTQAVSVTTNPATNLTESSATLNGSMSMGDATVTNQGFEYRVVGDTNFTTVNATGGTDFFSSSLYGLLVNNFYEYRAFVTIAENTEHYYGAIQSFEVSWLNADTILIYDADMLQWVSDRCNSGTTFEGKYIKLMNNIVLPLNQPNNMTSIGSYPFYPFKGTFDGNGMLITNLYIDHPNTEYQGFFGYTLDANLYEVGLVNITASGRNYTGGMVAYASNTYMRDCYVSGGSLFALSYCGGLVGYQDQGTNSIISGCYNTCTVSGNHYVGGLVGFSNYATVRNSYVAASVTGQGDGIGAIIGGANEVLMYNCFFSSSITGQSSAIGENNFKDGEGMSDEDMRDPAFVATLNQGLVVPVWKSDYATPINNGFPILIWQYSDVETCDAPTNPNAVVNGTSVTLSWTGGDNASYYVVEYGIIGGETHSENTSSHQITLHNLSDGNYFWRVKSICSFGESNFVNGNTITVGIDDHEIVDFKVFPNPTTGVVNVQCTMNNVQLSGAEIRVVDMYGKLLQTKPFDDETTYVDMSQYANGVYFVKAVADGKTIAVRKVVKQ